MIMYARNRIMSHGFAQQPDATSPNYPNHESDDDGEEGPFFFPELEGAAFRSKATTFAVIGIFFLASSLVPWRSRMPTRPRPWACGLLSGESAAGLSSLGTA